MAVANSRLYYFEQEGIHFKVACTLGTTKAEK
jgi:hypothetical protein